MLQTHPDSLFIILTIMETLVEEVEQQTHNRTNGILNNTGHPLH